MRAQERARYDELETVRVLPEDRPDDCQCGDGLGIKCSACILWELE